MSATPLNITMIGTGYVGLVSGACFADIGCNVTCMDIDAEKIRKLRDNGEIPIYEPGLDAVVARNMNAGRLKFTTELSECVPQSDMVFIAVGTPQDEDGSADLKYVLAAAKDIAKHLDGYTVIVNKSTVPVGTGSLVVDAVKEVNTTANFDVASNPEFLREGAAVEDFSKPDRVVVGVESEASREMMERLYQPLVERGAKLVVTDRSSSELIKYAANAFLATKITFINEIAALCEALNANVHDVSHGMGLDSRIGEKFLNAGPGYGGSCFPKDTNALAKTARDAGCPLRLVEETITTNKAVKQRMLAKILQAAGGNVSGKTIGVLGLAFKAETDDMRDASSLTILPELAEKGATVVAYDPAAMGRAKQMMPQLTYVSNVPAVLEQSDILVVLTEWAEFKTLTPQRLMHDLKTPVVVDLRNLFDPAAMAQVGITYTGLGVQSVVKTTSEAALASAA